MRKYNKIQETVPFDIQLEVLAAAILKENEQNSRENKIDLEQLVVSLKGHGRRQSDHEVASVRRKQYDHESVLFFELHRKGLFDTLPAALFIRHHEKHESRKAKFKAIKQQQKEARKLFLPFEQAIYHPRIKTELQEQYWTENFPDFITDLWGLNDFKDILDDRQILLLCYLLPEVHRVVGDWVLTALCFEAVLQKEIKIAFVEPKVYPIPKDDLPSGESRMGALVLGDHFRNEVATIEVQIYNISSEELEEYLPEGTKRKLLEELLYSYFLPIEMPYETKIFVNEDAYGFGLGEAVLGYNAKFLKPKKRRSNQV